MVREQFRKPGTKKPEASATGIIYILFKQVRGQCYIPG